MKTSKFRLQFKFFFTIVDILDGIMILVEASTQFYDILLCIQGVSKGRIFSTDEVHKMVHATGQLDLLT